MNLHLLQGRSIKTRITLFTLGLFMVGIAGLALYISTALREDMQQLLSQQQFSTATLVAADMDRDIGSRLQALGTVAAAITPEMLDDLSTLRSHLQQRPLFVSLFNGGIVFYRRDGLAVVEIPTSVGRLGINYSERDYLIGALKDGKATIGKPHWSKSRNFPEIIMSVPIRAPNGQILGALAGVTNLAEPNFLDQYVGLRYGESGGYVLVSAQDRLVITATDKRRMLEPLPAPGINPAIDRFLQGFEGSTVMQNPQGQSVLTSDTAVPVAGWVLAVALPTAEAFAPIRSLQQRMLLATLLFALLAGGTTWCLLRRELLPMLGAVRTLSQLVDSEQPLKPLPVTRRDEIGKLMTSFNGLIDKVNQRDLFLQQVFDTSSVAIYVIDAQGRIKHVNQRMADMFACTVEALVEREYVSLLHPTMREAGHLNMMALLANSIALSEVDRIYCRDDHTEFWGHLRCRSFEETNGNGRFIVCVINDITEAIQARSALEESESRYRTLIEWSPEAALVHHAGRLLYANPAAVHLFGADSLQALTSQPLLDLVAPQSHALVRERMALLATTEEYLPKVEEKLIKCDGTVFDALVQAKSILYNGVRANYSIVRDISESKKAQAELRIAATAFESQQGMTITNREGLILRVNQAFTRITGYSAAEVVGKNPRVLASGRHDAAFYRGMWQAIAQEGVWQGEIWNRRKSGEVYPEWLTVSEVQDDAAQTTNYVAIFSDISAHKSAESQIMSLAFYDPLTHLPNRRLLLDRLEQALVTSARHQSRSALLYVDLDNFKTINETLGQSQGDLLLESVAKRLLESVREGDTVARLGGDEFVVLLEDLSLDAMLAATQAEMVGQKVSAALGQPYRLGAAEHHSTASIGITLFGEAPSETLDEPLKRAELAMYQAKAAGRNALRFFEDQMQVVVAARAALEDDLRYALREQQFFLHYQAQVVGDGRLTGAEALLRWRHPQRGMVPPLEFITLAEETGMILPLGQWVLETACQQLAAWAAQAALAHLTLAVNVSAKQFYQADFVTQVLATLARTGANPKRLKLELTESLLVHDVEGIIAKMGALKAHGVGFSLDDFGTGYSSLQYLKRLPLDQLKIDQGFVRNILTDSNDAAIAKMVVALAESLGLTVIAEGVEMQEQKDFLAHLGCHAYQGYFFSRPVALAEFEKYAQPGLTKWLAGSVSPVEFTHFGALGDESSIFDEISSRLQTEGESIPAKVG